MVRDTVLIVMAKPPEKGLVKTRLAAELGDGAALGIYVELLKHTFEVAQKSGIDTVVFFSKPTAFTKEFEIFHHQYQQGADLGERMIHALEWGFGQQYESVIMIGTDCPDLTVDLLREAERELRGNEVVLGPSEDGGYYLIGMSRMRRDLLEDMPWSTDEVLPRTVKRMMENKISCGFLKHLNDIDTAEDWNLSTWKKSKRRIV